MAQTLDDREKILTQHVRNSLAKAEADVNGLSRRNTRMIITGLSSSAAATLVAGVTAASGPVVGTGIPGWRLACSVAAILAFIATVATGVQQQLKYEERLVNGNQCVGRLRALDVALTTGSRSLDDIGSEYEDIARSYPEFVGSRK
jgi:hypothetical protein